MPRITDDPDDGSETPWPQERGLTLKVILPAALIPLGSTVSKRTGRAQYTLGDRLRLFSPNEAKKEIIAQEGTRFLIGTGDANAISDTTELVWEINEEDLLFWLEGRQNGEPQ